MSYVDRGYGSWEGFRGHRVLAPVEYTVWESRYRQQVVIRISICLLGDGSQTGIGCCVKSLSMETQRRTFQRCRLGQHWRRLTAGQLLQGQTFSCTWHPLLPTPPPTAGSHTSSCRPCRSNHSGPIWTCILWHPHHLLFSLHTEIPHVAESLCSQEQTHHGQILPIHYVQPSTWAWSFMKTSQDLLPMAPHNYSQPCSWPFADEKNRYSENLNQLPQVTRESDKPACVKPLSTLVPMPQAVVLRKPWPECLEWWCSRGSCVRCVCGPGITDILLTERSLHSRQHWVAWFCRMWTPQRSLFSQSHCVLSRHSVLWR